MEHPALIVGAPDKFAVHLTDLTDFAPLRTGRITLTFRPRGGLPPSPRLPGDHSPPPPPASPGLVVYATAADAPRDEGGAESGVSFLKEQQWKTPGFATAFATDGEVAATFEASGVLEAQAGRLAQVSAPVAGLIDVSGRRPRAAGGAAVLGAPRGGAPGRARAPPPLAGYGAERGRARGSPIAASSPSRVAHRQAGARGGAWSWGRTPPLLASRPPCRSGYEPRGGPC